MLPLTHATEFTRRRARTRKWWPLALLTPALLASASASSPPPPEGSDRAWRVLEGLGSIEGIRDVALGSGLRFAVADARGVVVGRTASGATAGSGVRRVNSHGACTRVRFGDAGGLFAVGERGLIHVDGDGRVTDRTPRVGQGGRGLVALDAGYGWLAVGGEGGLWVARLAGPADAQPGTWGAWRREQDGLSPGLVSDVAIGAPARSGATPLWIVAEGELHLAWLEAAADAPDLRVSPARVQRPAGRPIGEAVSRVRVDPSSGDVHVLYARAIARTVGAPLDHTAGLDVRWEVDFPRLPPAAELADIAFDAGAVWWASSAGVLRQGAGRDSVVRAAPPVGSRPAHVLAVRAGVIWAAGPDRLWLGTGRPPQAPVVAVRSRMPRDPELARVHVEALQYLGLGTAPVERMWRGLSRRAWLPSMTLHGGADYGSGHGRDYDENFSYGQLNALNDRSSDRSTDFDAGIALSWDFADLAWSPESIDLSRESRQLIGLRDNVLDELNQLYFDRQRALRALSAFADWSDPEAAALRLRALELAAGLDGWTGGWFSAHVELRASARASWSPRSSVPAPRSAQFHPDAPVPTRAGRNDS